ncbi:MAG: translation elongation factor Ts [candidate division Zixibacteria bacterium]|nr:translation elongation factor Ts [candidate division Zixibacteria bacterium]MDH3939024.1 translation elongation factor Ts [candidate division Zixibacteria bacterium]
MQIDAKMVKELREQTGAGMMDCKKALSEVEGDFEQAVKVLREKGIAKAAKRSGRSTSEGLIASYIHAGDKLGVMVEVACETDFVARTDDFKGLARDIAMHVAAAAPLCVERDDVDSSLIEKEREIYRQQALNEGKPEKIVDKIVDGKIEKYISEIVLMEQAFVKDNDKTIADLLKEKVGTLGENIQIKRFSRFRLGE